MKLILKFNLVFIAIFLIGLGAAGYVSNQLLQQNAREEILQNARLVMETSLSTRAYTSSQVRPLLETQMKYQFLPQSVPAYSATEVLTGGEPGPLSAVRVELPGLQAPSEAVRYAAGPRAPPVVLASAS